MAKIKRRLNVEVSEPTKVSNEPEVKLSDNEKDLEDLKSALNITDEDLKGGESIKTETIDLNDKTKSENHATIDYNSPNFIDDFVSAKTHKVEEDDKEENIFKGKSTEDIKKEISNAENQSGDSMSPEDFYSVADIIITILDTFLANMMKLYAKDTNDSGYSLGEKKKKQLTKMLASILIKYQAKFKTEFLFIFALILFYAAPFIAARQRRKEIQKIEQDIIDRKAAADAAGQEYVPPVEPPINKSDIVEEAVVMHEQNDEHLISNLPVSLRPKKGAQRKK